MTLTAKKLKPTAWDWKKQGREKERTDLGRSLERKKILVGRNL